MVDLYLVDKLIEFVEVNEYFIFVLVVEFVCDEWKGRMGWVYYVVMVDYVDFVNI